MMKQIDYSKRCLLAFLFSMTVVLAASAQQKQLYTPVEWQYYAEAETLLYKKNDTANKYTWSESRSRQSANCIVYWDKNYGSTAPDKLSSSDKFYVDIDDLLAKAESFYQLESSQLGFVDPQKSNVSKYKIMILLNHTTEWVCYGGGYDFQISALWLSPSTCHPVGSAVAHEVGHSFHYMCYAEDSNHGASSSIQTGFHGAVGNGSTIWETTANWQALQSYPNEIFTESGTADIFAKSHNYAFTHEWHRYQAYMFFFYLCQKYGDVKTIANVWNHRETTVKDFNEVLMDEKNLSVNDLYRLHFEFAMRAATWDLDACAPYRDGYIGNFDYHYIPLEDGSYQVAYASCPQSTGFNVIPLNVPAAGTTITTRFTALTPGCKLADGDPAKYLNGESQYADANVSAYNSVTGAAARGFRVGYVALLQDGTRQYFDDNTVHGTGSGTGEKTEDVAMTVPANVSQLWLIVAPTPTSYFQHQWDENVKNDDQWPYRFKLVNTDIGKRATAHVAPTIDGRAIKDVTLTYDVTLKPDAEDYSVATVTVGGRALAALCTAFQQEWSAIEGKIVTYNAAGPSNNQVMLYAANADGTLQESGSTANGYGHWFNASGSVIGWGDNSYAYSEMDTGTPAFRVGQYPGRNASGDRYTIRQALRYKDGQGNTATAYFVFNITFDANANNSSMLASVEYGDPWLVGDVDMNHEITVTDVAALVNVILGRLTDYREVLADVNDDGDISIADVTALVNILLRRQEARTVYLSE